MHFSCRESFVVAMSDGFDNSNRNDPFDYGPSAASPGDNSAAFCELIGDADGDAAAAHETSCTMGSNWQDMSRILALLSSPISRLPPPITLP